MKKNKITLTRTGEQYTCKYLLDTADIVDTKVDMGMSGRFPQIIPCNLVENGGQREFVYTIGSRTQMTEFLKKEINKKQMLTLLYNVLDALETFGMNMISLSYVAKDIQYLFVNPETLDVSFIVAAVDRETTDLNEVRNFVKDIICNATYFEMDKDNYVAKLITFANKRGTFSVNDMKKYVENMLLEMGIHIEDEKKKAEKTEKAASGKVSRVGVMQNNAKMMPPQGQPMPPQMGPNGQPMQGRPMPPQGQPMPPQMGPNGQPMQGRPKPPQMGANGQPMQGRPMPPQGQPMPPQMGPDGKPMQGRPMPPQMGPNGQPMPGRPMPPQMGPNGQPMQGRPMPPTGQPMPPQMGANGQPMQGRPVPPQMGANGQPMQGRPVPPQMGANGQPMQGRPMPPQGQPMPPQGQPMQGRPMPPQMGPDGKPMQGRPMPPQMGPDGKPMQGRPMPPQMGANGQPMQGRPMPPQMGPDGKPMQGRPMPPQMGPDGKPIQGQPVPPMTQEKPETPAAPMTQEKPETPAAPVTQETPQAPVPYLLRVSTNEKIYINKPEFTIGRSATKADYTVDNNSDVSRIHCIIERKNGVSYIRDNQSTNGTFVNGNNIAGQENVFLTNNAKVSLGDESFIYFVK